MSTISRFEITSRYKSARTGILHTPHGDIHTPIFMPVGTVGSVKSLSPEDLETAGAEIILGNTYHLNLRPTSELVKEMGGLHKFMNWHRPILTDSGGFQAFSLGAMIADGVKKTSGKNAGPKTYNLNMGGVKEGSRASTAPRDSEEDARGKPRRQDPLKPGAASRQDPFILAGPIADTPGKPRRQDPPLTGGKTEGSRRRARTLSEVEGEDGRRETVLTGPVLEELPRKAFAKITDAGVEFRSHIDGSTHFLSPERSIDIQQNLGSDICLVLDELLSPTADSKYIARSLERTHRWEIASLEHFRRQAPTSINPNALIFGIVQGVQDKAIRESEADWASQQDFDGISIGGSMGNPDDWAATRAIQQTMSWVVPRLPEEWPKHALGIGEIADFFNCVEMGIDMFDCVAPTRRARNGSLYISPKSGGTIRNKFTLNVSNSKFAKDSSPIDPLCRCYTCQNFSRSYIRHLFMASELLFHRLTTIHNVTFCLDLTRQIREAIQNKQFEKLKNAWI